MKQPDFVNASELHPHQISGLNWLLYNFSSKKNCILADEMGLGKTIQTISFLVSLYEDSKIAPFLVLVPLSTASNWEREFAKWAPQLYTVTLTGNVSSRETIKKYELFPPGRKSQGMQAHVIITSYEMLMMEKSVLTQTMWEAVVVDEGQRLKNQDSKLFKELSEFKSNFRLLLTGTPLQNSLKELFTLLSFLDSEKFKDPKALEEEFARLDDEDKVGWTFLSFPSLQFAESNSLFASSISVGQKFAQPAPPSHPEAHQRRSPQGKGPGLFVCIAVSWFG